MLTELESFNFTFNVFNSFSTLEIVFCILSYILDEDDFEVVPTINRTLVAIEVEEERIYDDIIFDSVHNKDLATFSFIFKPFIFDLVGFMS